MENLTQPGGAATPQSQSSEPNTAKADGQDKAEAVTKADLEKFADEIAKRITQSNRDRNKAVDAELKSIRVRLEGAGLQISKEQETALRENIEQDMTQRGEAGPEPSGPSIDPSEQFVYDSIKRVYASVGAVVKPTDPEHKIVEKALNDPNGSLADTILAAQQAATLLSNRLKTEQEQAYNRILGGGTNTLRQGQPDASARSLWSEAYKK